MKRTLIFTVAVLALAAVSCTQTESPKSEYLVAAYVWPSCHDDSLAHAYLWPEGIGEWEVIKQGDPRFKGHYQPKQPLWGYEMDDDPVVVEKWINIALKYGDNTDLLFSPDVTWDQFKVIVDRVINQYFKLPNYVKFDGCPVMAIFSMDNLVRSFGSMEETARAIAYFREKVKEAGFPDMNTGFGYLEAIRDVFDGKYE